LEIFEVFRTLYRSGSGEFRTWCLPWLITYSFPGIYEGGESSRYPEVKNKALSILKEAVEDPIILEEIVNHPFFGDEHFTNDSFLIKCLSDSQGLEILSKSGWIKKTLKKWKETESLQYVKQVTALLNEELIKGSTDFSESYAYVISSSRISLSEDLRNDSVVLKRLPITLKISVDNINKQEMFHEYVHTFCQVDPSGLTLTGNLDNSVKFSNSLNLKPGGNTKLGFGE